MNMSDYTVLEASDGEGEPIRAAVQAPRDIGSSSLTVNLTTNWPTGTFIATTGTLLSSGKLDPTTVQVFYGTCSGATITITSFAPGYTDLGNSIGDVVVIKPTTEWANLASKGVQSTTQFPAQFANFVEPAGGVWSTSSGLIGQATPGNVWYNGVRSVMPLVTSNTFTASKDTYIDFNPSSLAFTYVPETNGAAEPAVTSGCVRVALVVTGASAISSISQVEYNAPVGSAQVQSNSVKSPQLALSHTLDSTNGVQSFTNSGTAGGTFYYINLGGLKLMWGTTGFMGSSSTGGSSTLIMPAFFNSIQQAGAMNGTGAGTVQQLILTTINSDTQLTFTPVSINGSSTSVVGQVLIIGT